MRIPRFKEEVKMRRLWLGIAAAAVMLVATAPASAQFYVGADPGGAGVQVGPLGIGVGPDYWGYHRRYWRDYAYVAPYCHLVRTRIVTPRGEVFWRTRRVCE